MKDEVFNGLVALVQYQRKDGVGSWSNMAAFDSEYKAERYAEKCSTARSPWEYQVVPVESEEDET